ncbi:M10 family metallopeptidase [Pseudomonas sp. SWRI179]|uniref:M10 family metallopeptidase n=1 Tax=Pseudomonas sp. SWRI179 TaxID=2745497 RepID=UPI0016468867|nr:M10 family metallopeptidase [Pseudomonas sp. SWRI179]MBC3382872.1 M10 family metallopeptidase C-terminal domain-containing protein [Pseudomonas sp. SWRI179]
MPTPVGYSYTSSATLTGNAQVDSLLVGTYWMGNTWSTGTFTTPLTYSFMTETSRFVRSYSSDNEYEASYVLTSAQQNGITSALGMWGSIANIKFTQVSESYTAVGDLRFGGYLNMDSDTAAWGYFPADTPSGGDVWLGPVTNNPAPDKGTYDYLVFMHEIGHALGLKHPFSQSLSNTTVLADQFDDVRNTIMSYNTSYSYEPTTPMVLDIAAIQSLYGANTQWQTGNNTYRWESGQSVFETIWDAGGVDTIDASNQLAAVRINLNEGQFSKIGQAFLNLDTQTAFNEGLAIAYGAKIENAFGSANGDTLIGNALANVLNGRAGEDTMIGGAGNDTYVIDSIGDKVQESSTLASEIDAVISSVSYVLGANLETLRLGASANINGTGNALNNRIDGNAGANTLDGGSGIDNLMGGAGNDTYVVDNLKDVVSETSALASEIDTVRSSVGWTLGANLENLILAGSASINGSGNALNNVLTGNAGNNVLNGGAGWDTLIGGAGNDTYVVNDLRDIVSETSTLAGEIDTVRSSQKWSLGANLENLTLTGSAHLKGGGNALNNVLIGNAGNNELIGWAGSDTLDGGSGIDTLVGGTGNDTYVVDDLKDIVSETSTLAGEIDTVRSSQKWSLGANLENLTLTGSAHLKGGGNALDNVLIGNAGNNELSGWAGSDTLDGGSGIDTLVGGTGNDTYVVDNLEDIVSETSTLAGEIDTVHSSQKWSLGANLENLTLTGSAHLKGGGNALDNVLIGNDGNNVLSGWAGNDMLSGGLGTDSLTGGTGSDRFVFNTLGELGIGSLRDTVSDFSSLQGDKLDLSKLDANLLTAFADTFSFIDSNGFTAAGQLRFVDQVLYGNINGDLAADFEIQLTGVNTLNANDLIA